MKFRLEKTYRCYELYGDIEINTQDYPEFEGKSEEEILEYLNENMYDFELKNGSEPNLIDQFEFTTEMKKQIYSDEDYKIHKIEGYGR